MKTTTPAPRPGTTTGRGTPPYRRPGRTAPATAPTESALPALGKLEKAHASFKMPTGFKFLDEAEAKAFLEGRGEPDEAVIGAIVPSVGSPPPYAKIAYREIGFIDFGRVKREVPEETFRNALQEGVEGAGAEDFSWKLQPQIRDREKTLRYNFSFHKDGEAVIHQVSVLLGRRGIVTATTVTSDTPGLPGSQTIPFADTIHFDSGHRYENFQVTDTVAKAGLADILSPGAKGSGGFWGPIIRIGAVLLGVGAAAFAAAFVFLRIRRRKVRPAVGVDEDQDEIIELVPTSGDDEPPPSSRIDLGARQKILERIRDKNYEEAYELYSETLRSSGTRSMGTEIEPALGDHFLSERDFGRAARVLENLVSAHPPHKIQSEIFFNLGYAYFMEEDPGKAARYLRLFIGHHREPAKVERAKKILRALEERRTA